MIEIKRRDEDKIIHSGEFNSVKECVEDAVGKGVSLYKANLYGADLSGVNLSGADLSGADLRVANLYVANLYEANLYVANLYEANLSGAKGIRTFTAGEHNRLCFTYICNNEQRWQLGCFNGNYKETREAVKGKYGEGSHYYKMIKATKGSV